MQFTNGSTQKTLVMIPKCLPSRSSKSSGGRARHWNRSPHWKSPSLLFDTSSAVSVLHCLRKYCRYGTPKPSILHSTMVHDNIHHIQADIREICIMEPKPICEPHSSEHGSGRRSDPPHRSNPAHIQLQAPLTCCWRGPGASGRTSSRYPPPSDYHRRNNCRLRCGPRGNTRSIALSTQGSR